MVKVGINVRRSIALRVAGKETKTQLRGNEINLIQHRKNTEKNHQLNQGKTERHNRKVLNIPSPTALPLFQAPALLHCLPHSHAPIIGAREKRHRMGDTVHLTSASEVPKFSSTTWLSSPMGGNLAQMPPVHVRGYPPSGLTSPVLCRPGYKNHSHCTSQCKGAPWVPALRPLFSPSPVIHKVENLLATCKENITVLDCTLKASPACLGSCTAAPLFSPLKRKSIPKMKSVAPLL